MKRFALLVLAASCLSAVTDPDPNRNCSVKELAWLTGTWKNSSPEGELYETWTTSSDTLMLGKSYMIANKDTVFSETLKIACRKGELFYLPVVKGQNDGKEIAFKLARSSSREFIFENIAHDFPQRIIYIHTKPDSLCARIEGMQNGKPHQEEFLMSR
jgi:hypothetical protein